MICFFTFGIDHENIEGHPMRDYFVKVHGADFMDCRIKFINNFALPVMGSARRWSMQYTEEDWDSTLFAGGCFEEIM